MTEIKIEDYNQSVYLIFEDGGVMLFNYATTRIEGNYLHVYTEHEGDHTIWLKSLTEWRSVPMSWSHDCAVETISKYLKTAFDEVDEATYCKACFPFAKFYGSIGPLKFIYCEECYKDSEYDGKYILLGSAGHVDDVKLALSVKPTPNPEPSYNFYNEADDTFSDEWHKWYVFSIYGHMWDNPLQLDPEEAFELMQYAIANGYKPCGNNKIFNIWLWDHMGQMIAKDESEEVG
jgi:hypothetical protein